MCQLKVINMKNKSILAFDLVATSECPILCSIENGRQQMNDLPSFPNQILQIGLDFHWNRYSLFEHFEAGHQTTENEGVEITSNVIDRWGVDFAIIANDGSILGAYYNCNEFISLTFPNLLNSIGTYAFSGSSCFTSSLTIPNSLTEIGGSPFYKCCNFFEVKLHLKITKNRNSEFYNCSNLTKINMPRSIQSNVCTNTFEGKSKNFSPLFVTESSTATYLAAEFCMEFTLISEIVCTCTFTPKTVTIKSMLRTPKL